MTTKTIMTTIPTAKIQMRYGRYITWIHNCCQVYSASDMTTHFAINLFMKYKNSKSNLVKIGKRKLTFAAILVASKWCDDVAIYSIHLEEFYTHHGFNGKQISEIEWWLLCQIQYTFHAPAYESLLSAVFRIYPNGNSELTELSSYLLVLGYCLFERSSNLTLLNPPDIQPYQYMITARRILENRNVVICNTFHNLHDLPSWQLTESSPIVSFWRSPCIVSGVSGISSVRLDVRSDVISPYIMSPIHDVDKIIDFNRSDFNGSDFNGSDSSQSEDNISEVTIEQAPQNKYLPDYDVKYPGLPAYILDALGRVHNQYKKSTKFDFAFVI